MLNYKKFIFFIIFFFLLGISSSGANSVKKSFDEIIEGCEVCHGNKGNSTNNETLPKLAGQNKNYLIKQMQDFQSNTKYKRDNPIMKLLMIALSDNEKIKIANYYSKLVATIDIANSNMLSLGQGIYRGGDLKKGLPACLACHGPAGLGNPSAGFPRLSGQHAQYIATQLKAFRMAKRNNDKFQMMSIISRKMSEAEIIAVSNYISGLHA
jgi:cytochrome c553